MVYAVPRINCLSIIILVELFCGLCGRYYNSQYDDIAELLKLEYMDTVAKLTRLATAVAATLYTAATNAMLPNIEANESTVSI